jgi:adenosylcobinamide-phosphate synthase
MMWPVLVFANAALAVIVERYIGYPKAILDAIGHPVIWMGRLISLLDRSINRPAASLPEGRLRGVIALTILMAAAFIPGWIIASLLAQSRVGWIVEALLATSLIAQKSMRDHVLDVRKALNRSLPEARKSVSKIVGRDPSHLDESGVSKAALESLAENASDGIVAPVLWYALLGLPGLAVYKAINTADSMIGHKSEKYLHFGWAAARLDDLVNIPASRLTGLLFAVASRPLDLQEVKRVIAIMRRDAPKHGSPNAGWPEAAMAAALGLRFGGPRSYAGERVDLPWMGEGRTTMNRDDIKRGLKLFSRAMWLLLALLLVFAIIL